MKNKAIIYVGDREADLELKSLKLRIWILEAYVKFLIYLVLWLIGL